MRIIAKAFDTWHLTSNYYKDESVVYNANPNFSIVKEYASNLSKYRKTPYYNKKTNNYEIFGLVVIGNYMYPIELSTDSTSFTLNSNFNSAIRFNITHFVDHRAKYKWCTNPILDKEENIFPDMTFGIVLFFRDYYYKFGNINITTLPKNNGFYDLFTPEFIWQEVSMYIAKEKDLPTNISDIDKLQQAGFDKKTSFRKVK